MLATVLAVFTTNPIANFAIWIVIIIAIIALVTIYVRLSGVQIPPWMIQAFWVVAGAVIIILLIIFLVQIAGSPGPVFGP